MPIPRSRTPPWVVEGENWRLSEQDLAVRRLWCAVLERALMDAVGIMRTRDGVRGPWIHEARQLLWAPRRRAHLEAICEAAGLDPEATTEEIDRWDGAGDLAEVRERILDAMRLRGVSETWRRRPAPLRLAS